MSCPICSHNELAEGAESCPKCGSDLEIFSHIESAKREISFQRKSLLVLASLLGVVVVSWGSASLFSGSKPETTEAIMCVDATSVAAPAPNVGPVALTAAVKPVDEFVKENEVKPEIEAPVASATVKTPAVTPSIKAKAPVVKEKVKKHVVEVPAEGGVIIHKVRRGDSFWKISKKYFGNGSHAKQIAADNDLNLKKNIPLGTKLKINK